MADELKRIWKRHQIAQEIADQEASYHNSDLLWN